ncbi:exported protein of unknown function [endosymbiont DhMRE of Dentiscutata heterogama]|uniref:hypothetical protein n=1 Tax=endosymbiont DhMRE of Dentiscutata heterogama TaxID=1609546 RepID=UPI000629D33D|nr:hypothetical protein [endosymbiont DhMRE of Dentiscutata heterogama]CFW92967.1 exported protein of unknown function [endosymbiont DhMRE of Dentiscutata heterogama]
MNIIKKFIIYAGLALSLFGIGTGVATSTTGTGVKNGSWILEKTFEATKYAGQGIEIAGAKLKDGSQYLNTWATNSLLKEEYRDLYFSPYTFSEKIVEQDWVLVN